MNKKYILGGGFLVILAAIFIILNNYPNPKNSSDYQLEEYQIKNLGVSFEYKSGLDNYVVDDLSSLIGEQPSGTKVLGAYRVMNTKDKIELETAEGGYEGPPTINLLIFSNNNNQSASMWVDSFPLFSNINLVIGDVDRDAVVGGANAVKYRTDGLYRSDNVVVAHGGYIYHFTGSFMEEQSAIHRDFQQLIDSVEFTPIIKNDNTSQMKIDISVACNSALAYMLFASGEEADQFISDCIEGKHPEVIERYISDMNLDGASI